MTKTALPDHLVGFVHALRRHGVGVGPGETVDAGRVLAELDLLDRDVVREGLACTLVRRPSHRPTFDRLFDLWFPVAVGKRMDESESAHDDLEVPQLADGSIDLEGLQELLATQLAEGELPPQAVAALVEQLGQYESRSGPAFSAYQTLKQLDLPSLLHKLAAGLQTSNADAQRPDGVLVQVANTTADRRIADLRSGIEDEVRRRAAERVGRERVSDYAVPKQLEDINFLAANQQELAALRRTVQTLARLLASRIANRRRRFRRGEIDLRKTLRASMSTGGVPVKLVQRKPRVSRPELVVLCDISGSVAGFSQFTMLLMHALRENFSKIRIFAFIDSTDEVTQYFAADSVPGEVLKQIVTESPNIHPFSSSDYGGALTSFVERYPDAVTSRTSLLILGDARTNYRPPHTEIVKQLVATARHAHWLNPESEMSWASGDSAAFKYRDEIEMFECRSARQLTALIDRIIPVH